MQKNSNWGPVQEQYFPGKSSSCAIDSALLFSLKYTLKYSVHVVSKKIAYWYHRNAFSAVHVDISYFDELLFPMHWQCTLDPFIIHS